MSKRSSPKLSIIIPVHNGAQTLEDCIRALIVAPGPSRDIVVVDDASQDSSVEIATGLGVRVVRQSTNGGAGMARNVGVRHTRSPILVFVDCDVVIHPSALERIDTFFNAHPEYSGVFGSYDANPAAATTTSQYRNLLHHFTHQDANYDAETFWAGLGALRRSAFLCVGGFQENTSKGIEDIELGLRLTDCGGRVALDHQLFGTHLKCWTLGSMIRTDVFLRAKTWSALVLERGRFTNSLNTSKLHRLGVLSSGLFVVGCVLAPVSSLFMYLAVVGVSTNLVSNLRLYRQFGRSRGLRFALRVVPLHLIHQLCAGIGFALAALEHLCRKMGLAGQNGDFRGDSIRAGQDDHQAL